MKSRRTSFQEKFKCCSRATGLEFDESYLCQWLSFAASRLVEIRRVTQGSQSLALGLALTAAPQLIEWPERK